MNYKLRAMKKNILVVGCGGIGSELLKLLVLDEFKRIMIIDNDTIDITNLNRQFFYTREDVGKSKCLVAANKLKEILKIDNRSWINGNDVNIVNINNGYDKEAECNSNSYEDDKKNINILDIADKKNINILDIADKKNINILDIADNNCNFKYQHIENKRNIINEHIENSIQNNFVNKMIKISKSSDYNKFIKSDKKSNQIIEAIYKSIYEFSNIEWYKQFDIVYNCLDNNEARSFVNQRCHAADVRMIDGGSEGWLGQAFNNKMECFDCLPQKIEKHYPLCSVRQRAENFEHCLAWGDMIIRRNNQEELMSELTKYYPIYLANKNTQRENITIDNSKMENINFNNKLFKIMDKITKVANTKESSYTMELAYELACIKASFYKIEPYDFLKSQTILKRIIPSICTTNSIIASLMLLSAQNDKNYYLTQNTSIFMHVELNERRRNCFTCGIPLYFCLFNDHTTINDLLDEFDGSFLITKTRIIDAMSREKIIELSLNNQFGIIVRQSNKYRFLFQYDANIKNIKIIRKTKSSI